MYKFFDKGLRNIKSDKGMTIIEVMIAMVIFAIGIMAVSKMQLTSISGNKAAMNFTDAANIAMDQLEEIMITPYASVPLTIPATNFTENGLTYRITWTVTEDVPNSFNKKIAITVEWDEGMGGGQSSTRSMTVEHIISDLSI